MRRRTDSALLGDHAMVTTSFVIHPDQLDWIQMYADTHQLSRSDVMRRAIDALTRELAQEAIATLQQARRDVGPFVFAAE